MLVEVIPENYDRILENRPDLTRDFLVKQYKRVEQGEIYYAEVDLDWLRKKHSSATWVQITGIKIMDPDGWDRDNFEVAWREEISLKEFLMRAYHSTIDLNTLNAWAEKTEKWDANPYNANCS